MEPVITTVRTVDEAKQLPEDSLVIWRDSVNDERQAAVVRVYDGQRSMEHTKSGSYWVDGIHMIEYPALALTWPTTDPVGEFPAAILAERPGPNSEEPVLDEISQLVDEQLAAGEPCGDEAKVRWALGNEATLKSGLITELTRELNQPLPEKSDGQLKSEHRLHELQQRKNANPF